MVLEGYKPFSKQMQLSDSNGPHAVIKHGIEQNCGSPKTNYENICLKFLSVNVIFRENSKLIVFMQLSLQFGFEYLF